ncbi:unnamed protein product [Lactuca virosa]|uniref:Uncharacterized protein n=1 Tax=Lactuca virosa TaxID=75947 RepID=A0AAU9MJB7_9ASTR|nr:unnamed protein product [Lactuca virosa]
MSGSSVLVRIQCQKNFSSLMKALTQMQNLGLSIISSSAMPFAKTTLLNQYCCSGNTSSYSDDIRKKHMGCCFMQKAKRLVALGCRGGIIYCSMTWQEDIRSYIDDSIKHGVHLSAFRKERTGGDSHRVSYWYENDPIIGQRLYHEIKTVEVKKGKGKNIQSVPSYHWETIATNLDEFQDVSEKLSSSKNRTESSLGKKLEDDILPEIKKVVTT